MDGIQGNMEVFQVDLDVINVKLKGLTKFLQERLPECDKVIHKNHNEEKKEYEL